MLVKNNLPTVLDFGDPKGSVIKDPKGIKEPVFVPGMSLIPGVNEVNEETWELWTVGDQKCASMDWHLRKKNLEVIKAEIEKDEESGHSIVASVAADDFADLNADEAIDLVEECFDLVMLERWEDAEKAGKERKTVLRAIDAQVKKMNTEAPKGSSE